MSHTALLCLLLMVRSPHGAASTVPSPPLSVSPSTTPLWGAGRHSPVLQFSLETVGVSLREFQNPVEPEQQTTFLKG